MKLALLRAQIPKSAPERWTGPQFIATAGLFALGSIVTGGFASILTEEYAVIWWPISGGLMLWFWILLAVGIIRWGSQK